MTDWDKIQERLFDPYEFNQTVNRYTESTKIKVEKGCNAVQVTNLGTSTIQINGITLFPSTTPATVAGDSVSFGGNLGEVYKGNLDLTIVLPTGLTPVAEVIQKFYINFER